VTNTPAAVLARGLTKRFGDVLAVESGELFGHLSTNGAGQRATAMPGLIDLVAAR
jgi:ABC-type uncharacterized transport system ATPase subunit